MKFNKEADDTRKKLQQEYQERNKTVKKKTKRDKKTYVEKLANEAEIAARQNNSRELYNITRQLAGKNKRTSRPIRDKQGNLLTKESIQLQRWKEYVQDILSRPPPDSISDIEETNEDLNINCCRISKEETKRAIKKLKLGKAPGIDNIPSDVLKADIGASTDVLYNVLNEIWDKEEIPTEWKTGMQVTIPKKGNLSECKNWRGIMLSVPSKIICRIILERIQETVDKKLRKEQADFRKDKSCTDHIVTLRIIVEQCFQWQSSLYINFVDFEKAFDSIDRTALWKLLRHYGLPAKFVTLIKNMYEGFTGRVIFNGQVSELEYDRATCYLHCSF